MPKPAPRCAGSRKRSSTRSTPPRSPASSKAGSSSRRATGSASSRSSRTIVAAPSGRSATPRSARNSVPMPRLCSAPSASTPSRPRSPRSKAPAPCGALRPLACRERPLELHRDEFRRQHLRIVRLFVENLHLDEGLLQDRKRGGVESSVARKGPDLVVISPAGDHRRLAQNLRRDRVGLVLVRLDEGDRGEKPLQEALHQIG